MRSALALLLALQLQACATPAGQIPKEEFAWETVKLPIGYQAAYRNLRQGFQTCPGYVAEGDLYTDISEGKLTVYLAHSWPMTGRTDFVAGLITIKGSGTDRADLTLAVQNVYDKPIFGAPGKVRARWRAWAGGKVFCD